MKRRPKKWVSDSNSGSLITYGKVRPKRPKVLQWEGSFLIGQLLANIFVFNFGNRLCYAPTEITMSVESNFDQDMVDEQSTIDKSANAVYYGTSLADIPNIIRTPPILSDMQDIHDPDHVFLIKPFKYDPSNPDREPEPIHGMEKYMDAWDDDHVRLPCSLGNVTRDGRHIWPIIQKALAQLKQKCDEKTVTVHDIKTTIQESNGMNFEIRCLKQLINQVFSAEERAIFLYTILSKMISLALNVGTICGQPPRLLRQESNRSVTMSQRQASSLLACGFFCLFPEPHNRHSTYQSLNFTHLLKSGAPWKIEKLKCILHYFRRISEDMPKGVLTFRRFSFLKNSDPKWIESQVPLSNIHMIANATIEDQHGFLQVDFANEYIGGGVMNEGIVQEEIRFTICTEMLVSVLFCEVMLPNECIYLIGCEQFATYSGYADTFKAKATFIDKTPKDSWGRKLSQVVAMDAIYFRNPIDQYTISCMNRELFKAYASFHLPKSMNNFAFGIATGNWGCGAFNGDRHLKAIIQLMAASEARRPLIYCSFHDKHLIESFWAIYEYLQEQKATVGDLYLYLNQYSMQHAQSTLFEFIFSTPVSSLKKS
ncbi:unnamed protein product [Rotaria socialis]|uniref:poly(ADP-ribose) glycohydrolase n=4 Tax=Rotaria socialis TaxID=392032 RepID=A0A819VRS1_9BILA|nr:unnamed protein product [Rotaria socialis]